MQNFYGNLSLSSQNIHQIISCYLVVKLSNYLILDITHYIPGMLKTGLISLSNY